MPRLLVILLAATPGLLPAAQKPNIIVFMADDMGMGDTSAYQAFTGNADEDQVHTPNMERLARAGILFTDAHTPSSRCSPTRYGLLTGRYPWRNRLKHWVLFGSQGDPMIEADRPTIASMLRDNGYRTGMVGKWHVGLRYSQSDGSPAAGWADADLKQPMHTTPLDHGFGFARFTSRSHGTSGPSATAKNAARRNGPKQSSGPGHIDGRTVVGATGNGKQLVSEGPGAYVLRKLGSRHSDNAIEFLEQHLGSRDTSPFFLYYPSNSNHGPYTPDDSIGGTNVKGAARTKAGEPMDARHDYIYENDVALGRLLDWLESKEDPRNLGKKLIDNTLIIFTSDNGAENNSDIATGPFRSHKGSVYEGGHRVPFIAAWKAGGIGNADLSTPGHISGAPIGLQDLYATFSEIVGQGLPDLRGGEKGAEDSFSILSALRGQPSRQRPPLFFNDHSQAKDDPAVVAIRLDSPTLGKREFPGKWKLFFDAGLLRSGEANPIELYDLASDQMETNNRLGEASLGPLVAHLTKLALGHRNLGGHRLAELRTEGRAVFDWSEGSPLAMQFAGKPAGDLSTKDPDTGLTLTVSATREGKAIDGASFSPNPRGLGVGGGGGEFGQVDSGEALELSFDRDVIVESAAIVAGNGSCGGFYRVGKGAPLAIYCIDADNDAKDQHGILSDIGVLKKGERLQLDSSPHFGVETAGQWRLRSLSVRPLAKSKSSTR